MGLFVARKGLAALVALWLASMLIFFGGQALPGDPATLRAGDHPSPQAITQIREKYGLNDNQAVQYVKWVGLAAKGDFGESIRTGLEVRTMIGQRIVITLYLAVLSVAVGALIGIPLGILMAMKRTGVWQRVGDFVGLFGMSVPPFWLGIVLILVFAVKLRWLPASGYVPLTADPIASLQHMILPVVVLALPFAAMVLRQMCSSALTVLNSDYIKVARSKGLSEWQVVSRHVLRNSLVTVLTVIGLQLGTVVAGAVVVEQIFILPGFGRMILEAVFVRDYPVIQGAVMVGAFGFVIVNLVLDGSYALLNPKMRSES